MTQKNERGSAAAEPRKERVIHTRIPAVLDNELKNLATALRVPVSNLVRTILEDAVSAAEAVGRVAEEELRGVAERLGYERERLSHVAAESGATIGRAIGGPAVAAASAERARADVADPLDGALGFQSLLLARGSICGRCGVELPGGSEAFLVVTSDGSSGLVVGPECALDRGSVRDLSSSTKEEKE